jgi:Transcriptional regulator/sugar kinase
MPQSTRRSLRPEDARRRNRALVLQDIYDGPALSRADLARSTGLTKVTVSDLVAELMASGLVHEVGTSADTRPGKPSTLLTFDPGSRDILAIDLSARDQLRGAIFTLGGTLVSRIDRRLDGAIGEEALAAAVSLAKDLLAAATRPVLGLGVGAPGTIDAGGRVLRAPNLRWRDLPLQDLLAAELGLPVLVQNDANVAVLAERRFAGGADDLVRVQLSRGVGAGVLVGGQLVIGAASDAGEIGHVVIEEDGAICPCGKVGCLETWISVPALTARVEAEPQRRDQVLAEAGARLGAALAPVVGMLGLAHVVVGGPSELVEGPLVTATRETIAHRTQSDFRPELDLQASSLGSDAVLMGAVALVLLSELGVA